VNPQTLIGLGLGVSHVLVGVVAWYAANRSKLQPAAVELRESVKGLTDGNITVADIRRVITAIQADAPLFTALVQAIQGGQPAPLPLPLPVPIPTPATVPVPPAPAASIDFGRFVDTVFDRLAERFPHRSEPAK
jgi:hypothetical protein